MKQINLLSPLKQKHVFNLYLFLFARFIFILLLVAVIFAGLALGGAKLLLNESIQQITLHSSAIDKEFKTINKDIQEVNAELKRIEYALGAKNAESGRIAAILKETQPPAIVLGGLSESADGAALIVQGKAKDRSAALAFQARVKQLAFVEEATVPLDNLIKQDRIEFQMVVKFKK